jgi:peptide chain release factor 2
VISNQTPATSSSNSKASGGVFDIDQNEKRLEEIEKELSRPEAWDDHEALTPILKEKSRISELQEQLNDLRRSKEDLEEWLEMAEEEPSGEVLEALREQIRTLSRKINETELQTLLSDPLDDSTAILEVHPGAGGTEAQDWAEMLLRMYSRWAEMRGFKFNQLDLLPGDEAGIKSVTVEVKGDYAYGLLKNEIGIHRLIRISPFDSSGRRHTSFASVDVYPEPEKDLDVEVRDEDVRIEVFRASGPGGQHVNKTSSAVRLVHEPTGIVVQCQNEKSQLRNKETAFKILKARLMDLENKKRQEERQAQYEDKEAIAWGSQIRTYTLQPYRLVKDHRTGTEVGDVDAVLDGKLDELIRNNLLHEYANRTS